jgi:type IV pilus assembly protein PilA
MKGRYSQSGFTFIELMSVVAIIGILAAIMMPGVKNYVARSKVSEAVQALAACRTPVSEIFLTGAPGQAFPTDWGCAKPTGASKYVESIEVLDNAVIRVQTAAAMGDLRIAPKYVTLAPLARSGYLMTEDDQGDAVFRWRCGAVADGTDPDIDLTFLPSTCRGI